MQIHKNQPFHLLLPVFNCSEIYRLIKNRIYYNYKISKNMAKSSKTGKPSKPKAVKSKEKSISKAKSDPPVSSPPAAKIKRHPTKEQIKQIKEAIAHDYTINLEGGTYKIKMHQNYEIKEDHKLYKQINNLFLLFREKEEKRCLKTHRVIPHSNFPLFEFALRGESPTQLKCSICQFEFQDIENYESELIKQSDEDIITLPCSHLIHRSCFTMLKGQNEWIKCPICSSIYGMMIGDQPPGKMTWNIDNFTHCDGFPDVGTITIDYSMHSGKRGDIQFPGTHRIGYLPDNPQGNQVLKLLEEAFKRKLIFTIGRSVTTGRDNQVVWNGIHHKTSLSGGSAYFGYPDETYFKRVKLELAAKGIY